MAQITLLDTFTQTQEPHELTVDRNGDIVAQAESGHFIKFPAGSTAEDIQRLVEAHNEQNLGQVSAEEYNKTLEASQNVLAAIADAE